jgi:pyruvate dehydrogenase E2 component (dihydrolipoamide acetyltransferase)
MPVPVMMPQLGESVIEGTLTKWLKNLGERVEENEALMEVNTDKVDTEIPSPASGTLIEILIPEGTTVRAGATLAWIAETQLVGSIGFPSPVGNKPTTPAPVTPGGHPQPGRAHNLGFISPVVARIASEQLRQGL